MSKGRHYCYSLTARWRNLLCASPTFWLSYLPSCQLNAFGSDVFTDTFVGEAWFTLCHSSTLLLCSLKHYELMTASMKRLSIAPSGKLHEQRLPLLFSSNQSRSAHHRSVLSTSGSVLTIRNRLFGMKSDRFEVMSSAI